MLLNGSMKIAVPNTLMQPIKINKNNSLELGSVMVCSICILLVKVIYIEYS